MKGTYDEVIKTIATLEHDFLLETGFLPNTVIMSKRTYDDCLLYTKTYLNQTYITTVKGMKIHLKEEGKIEVGRMIEEGA